MEFWEYRRQDWTIGCLKEGELLVVVYPSLGPAGGTRGEMGLQSVSLLDTKALLGSIISNR